MEKLTISDHADSENVGERNQPPSDDNLEDIVGPQRSNIECMDQDPQSTEQPAPHYFQPETILHHVWPQKNVVSLVAGIPLMDIDINSLYEFNSLRYPVVDAKLRLLASEFAQLRLLPPEFAGSKVIHIGCEDMTSILNDEFYRDSSLILNMIDLSNCVVIAGAVLQNNHFTLIIIQPKEYKITFLDPVLTPDEPQHVDNLERQRERIRDSWVRYIQQRKLRNIVCGVNLTQSWNITTTGDRDIQTDYYNCGIFVILYAEQIFRNKKLKGLENCASARERFARELLQNSNLHRQKCCYCNITFVNPLDLNNPIKFCQGCKELCHYNCIPQHMCNAVANVEFNFGGHRNIQKALDEVAVDDGGFPVIKPSKRIRIVSSRKRVTSTPSKTLPLEHGEQTGTMKTRGSTELSATAGPPLTLVQETSELFQRSLSTEPHQPQTLIPDTYELFPTSLPTEPPQPPTPIHKSELSQRSPLTDPPRKSYTCTYIRVVSAVTPDRASSKSYTYSHIRVVSAVTPNRASSKSYTCTSIQVVSAATPNRASSMCFTCTYIQVLSKVTPNRASSTSYTCARDICCFRIT